jgi:hypothetical protein
MVEYLGENNNFWNLLSKPQQIYFMVEMEYIKNMWKKSKKNRLIWVWRELFWHLFFYFFGTAYLTHWQSFYKTSILMLNSSKCVSIMQVLWTFHFWKIQRTFVAYRQNFWQEITLWLHTPLRRITQLSCSFQLSVLFNGVNKCFYGKFLCSELALRWIFLWGIALRWTSSVAKRPRDESLRWIFCGELPSGRPKWFSGIRNRLLPQRCWVRFPGNAWSFSLM